MFFIGFKHLKKTSTIIHDAMGIKIDKYIGIWKCDLRYKKQNDKTQHIKD